MTIERPTIVVNIHRARDVVEEAKREGRFVLIDRTTMWGNPFGIAGQVTRAKWHVATREEAIAKYEEWLLATSYLVELLPTLRSKVLGCWCAPKPCHGHVLARLCSNPSLGVTDTHT